MSEVNTYKKIVDVEQVETLNDAATVFINDNGAMKQVAADEFGTVKTINGIEPDENGDVFTEDLADICIVDMTDVIPGKINMNYRNKPYAEIIDMLAHGGSNVRGAIVSRICLLSTGAQPVYTATAYDPFALNKMRIHFGDNICPIIIDAEANTITLDPDWVAPTSDVTIPSGATLTIEEGATVVDNAGALGGVFRVTFTPSDDGTFTADKTIDEISEAHNQGMIIEGVVFGDGFSTILQCTSVVPDGLDVPKQVEFFHAQVHGGLGVSLSTLSYHSTNGITFNLREIEAPTT